MGNWRVSAFFLVLILCWGFAGPAMRYSDSWQLLVNTPTTVIELFLALATLNSANRIEKRNWELHQNMMKMLEHVDKIVENEEREIQMLSTGAPSGVEEWE